LSRQPQRAESCRLIVGHRKFPTKKKQRPISKCAISLVLVENSNSTLRMKKFTFLCVLLVHYIAFHIAIAQKRAPRNFPEYGFFLNKQQLYIQELLEFLRIPSVSASSEHLKDVQAAAEWLKNRMLGAGIPNVQIFQVGQYPLVYASIAAAVPQAPTVLIYGLYYLEYI